MIQLLATRYNQFIASLLLIVFECSFISAYSTPVRKYYPVSVATSGKKNRPNTIKDIPANNLVVKKSIEKTAVKSKKNFTPDKGFIGGPGQPEMSSFKSVGTDNMVNLFTGDFSYNIPLLDVGGYPVNIFYDGGITPEQDASWVGLGWNINPGTVSRNMRGLPDDFDGTDVLTQTQVMKPNVTWGFTAGYDLELVGIKDFAMFSGSVGASLDLSFNNYLGPALGLGLKGSTSIKIAEIAGSDKSPGAIKLGGGISANINSRSGVTLSPSLSLTANAFSTEKGSAFGGALRLGTSYNSRSGIKQLQISEQMSYNYSTMEKVGENEYTGNSGGMGATSSSTISFSKPSYLPSIRMPLTNEAYSGHFQLGNALFGVYGSAEIEAYKQVSRVAKPIQTKPLVGYLYYQNAVNNPNAVMDFTRFNDNEVTPNTPIISAPQYSYDVFSIQGEGTGGSIRAYRNDMGYVRDNLTQSQDKNFSAGADVGVPGHYGANFNMITTPTEITEWKKGNKLKTTAKFRSSDKLEESVYFRNPGEMSVLGDNEFKRIGGTDLVRFKLGGTDATPTIEPVLERFSKTTNTLTGNTNITTIPTFERKKRTQVTNFLTAKEVSEIGLDRNIKNYSPGLGSQNNLSSTPLPRFYTNDPGGSDTWRKSHHISQINVTEANGRRYVYGLPVYNVIQKDFTFSVNGTPTSDDKIAFGTADATAESNLVKSSAKGTDGYVQITETPTYAHSFLLTGLLSPDYVDLDDNGISENDLGDAVKFNYSRYSNHKWRTPIASQNNIANFNDGNRTEKKDDKGIVSYGERESWYLHSIESKTMIALFTVEDRKDGKGVSGEQSAINTSDNSQKRLKKIDLYSKADLKKNGLTGTKPARPIKTVWFTYSYNLAANTPGNNGADETVNSTNVNSAKGKLTLDGIHFTFNGTTRTNKNRYVFSYTNNDGSGNPAYTPNASDRWGNYKPAANNPSLPNSEVLKNSDHPYSVQTKTTADQNAGAWSLKKILLPSGGQIEVQYESDDYAFVQNKRAATMMRIAGIGKDATSIPSQSELYRFDNGPKDNFYVFIEVPDANVDIKKTYLDGLDQLAFKLAVNMPKGLEYVNCYATIDGDVLNESYGKCTSCTNTIWVKLKPVRNGLSPLTLTVLDYLRERLPGQAFRGYDVSESTGLKQVAEILAGMLDGLKSAFKDPIMFLRSESKGRTIIKERSFVRWTEPSGRKYGGGQRVKSVILKDNWQAMTGQYTSAYGQQYDYSTTEVFNGVERSISSGVASYEPSIGGDENPFFNIIQVSDKLPLGPANYGAIEMPMLDAFFPAPAVGYSKVTVRSIQQGTIETGKKSRSGIGKQATEFYTAKDFPFYYNYTSLDPSSDKPYHKASLFGFFYKYAVDTRALSQGFVVETNDMHGKMKSQASYAEGDEKTRINYTENFYRNTGSNGLNEKFDFVHASRGGEVQEGNMGIDIEVMTDTREFSVKSSSLEVQGQLDLFPILFGLPWLPFIYSVTGNSENTYRAVTATKVINYHGVLDRVIVIDKGSMVTTKNLVYDAETGDVVVSSTQNEFDQPIYNVNYPAYWAYSGMGLAYKNIDAIYSGINFLDGKITNVISPTDQKGIFESGDELYLIDKGTIPSDCGGHLVSDPTEVLWAMDKNKPASGLSNSNPDFIFLDKKGKPYTRDGVNFRIIRSGKRNLLGATIATATLMQNPVVTLGILRKLSVNGDSKTINASAIEYREKWQTDNDVIKKLKTIQAENPNLIANGNFSDGNSGFLSQYSYTSSGLAAGSYWIGSNPSSWHSEFTNCPDHTSGNGNMLLVNGSSVAGRIIWSQTVNVASNTTYRLSLWAQSLVSSSPAVLRFFINGIQLSLDYTLSGTTCLWTLSQSVWSSGNNLSATISIVDINTNSNGNDLAIDDISFLKDICTNDLAMEVEDPDGYLEKSINPYRKGLLGNFRAYQNKVFYGSRVESDPLAATNIANNGFLSDFKLYWDFDTNNSFVPDLVNNKWVWNSEVKKFNSKGLELETVDALNIYTAAQYGYDRSLPVAIINNSKYEEMCNADFEDESYAETLENISNSTLKKHFDLAGISNATIQNTELLGFNAHTGKYVLGVAANSTASKTIPIQNNAESFDISLIQSTKNFGAWEVSTPGAKFYRYFGEQLCDVATGNSATNTWMKTYLGDNNPQAFAPSQTPGCQVVNPDPRVVWIMRFFYKAPYTGTYNVTSGIALNSGSYDLYIRSEKNEAIPDFSTRSVNLSPSFDYDHSYSFNTEHQGLLYCHMYATPQNHTTAFEMCEGKVYEFIVKYTMSPYMFQQTFGSTNGTGDWQGWCTSTTWFQPDSKFLNCGISGGLPGSVYSEKYQLGNSCDYTKPIAGSSEMMNPTFTLPSSKKMLFSGWIKQSCNNCSNKVTIDFGNGNSANTDFTPTGPIIEGWQRIEGEFTAPAGATTASLNFINNSGSTIYFDDIRIHPFNANMKSYVYDPVNLRLVAELDANNYASFYEYDEEGILVRTKAETKQGVKTITETRSFKQAAINQLQQ